MDGNGRAYRTPILVRKGLQNGLEITPENERLIFEKGPIVKGNQIFQPSMFRGYVSFQGELNIFNCHSVQGQDRL